MIPVYPFGQFLAPTTPAVNPNGTLMQTFYYLLRSVYLRTGGTSGLQYTAGVNLTATSGSAGPLALTDDYNEVLSGSGAGVQLANLQGLQSQVVYNGSGGNIDVYPFTGGQIDALALNAAYVLANGKTQIFWCPKLLASGAPFYRSTQLG